EENEMEAAAMNANQETRRAHDRTELHVAVTFESDHNFFMGFSENISEGGLFIATHTLRDVGTRIALTFELPGSAQSIRAICEVRWSRVYNETSDTPPGLGLSFVELRPEDARAISNFAGRRAP